jgi:hypothetical protein
MGMLYSFHLIDQLNLNSFYGQHALYELYTLLLFSIGIFEMRFLLQKMPAPRLTWFYNAYIDHEMQQFWTNWQDRVEELSRPFLAVSKEQIDYYLIHKEFIYIKKRSLSVYLENEKKSLDKHFYDRTVSMLKSIEQMENYNVKYTIRQAIEESFKIVLAKVESPEDRKSLHTSSFNSALKGLKTGKMTYEGDGLLPLFINEIKSRLEPLKKLSAEEERKMFALTGRQKSLIAEADHRFKIDFLANPPEVTAASVKNTDSYKGIIARMKTRIETNFKI